MHKSRVGRVAKGDKSVDSVTAVNPQSLNGHAYDLEDIGDLGIPSLHIPRVLMSKSRTSQTSPKIQSASPTAPGPDLSARSSLTRLAGGNITMLDNRLTLEDRLRMRNKLSLAPAEDATAKTESVRMQRMPSMDDPYAFSEFDSEPSKKKSIQTVSSISNLGLNVKTSTTQSPNHGAPTSIGKPSASPRPTSIARLYPQLAEKLEQSVASPGVVGPAPARTEAKLVKAEQKMSKGSQRSGRTMNRLQTKIAQNKIKDKMKKTSGGSKQPGSESVIQPSTVSSVTTNSSVPTQGHATISQSLAMDTTASKAKTKARGKAKTASQKPGKDACLRTVLNTAPLPYMVQNFPPSLSASERLTQLGQSCASSATVGTTQPGSAMCAASNLPTVSMTSSLNGKPAALSVTLHNPVTSVGAVTSSVSSLDHPVASKGPLGQTNTTVMAPACLELSTMASSLPVQTLPPSSGAVTVTSPSAPRDSKARVRSKTKAKAKTKMKAQNSVSALGLKTDMPQLAGTNPPPDMKTLMGMHPPLMSPVMPQQPVMVSPQPGLSPPRSWPPPTSTTLPGCGPACSSGSGSVNANMNTWWPPVDSATNMTAVPVNPKLQPLSVVPPVFSAPPGLESLVPKSSAPAEVRETCPRMVRCMNMVKPRRKRNILTESDVKSKIRRPAAIHLYSLHARRKVENSTFLPYGVDSSEDDQSDADDLLPWQQKFQTTFSDSDDEAQEGDDLDQEISSSIRRTKLELVRCKLRRHCTQIRHCQAGNANVQQAQRSVLQAMVSSIRDSENAALRVVTHICHQVRQPSKLCRQLEASKRACLHKNDNEVQCSRKALPFANHCLKHIMYNVDQQMFDYCTAKFSNNTQCCVPVFDIRHELPLCPEHAAKADNYQKNLDSKPKKPRKRTKPSALTRPPKKGKKKKNQKRPMRMKKAKSPEKIAEDEEEEDEETVDVADIDDPTADDITDIDVISSGVETASSLAQTTSQESAATYGGDVSSSQDSGVEVNAPAASLQVNDLQVNDLRTTLQSDVDQSMKPDLGPEEDPLSPDTIDKSLDLTLDHEQATELFAEHDLHDVLNKLPQEAFDLFTGKNGDFISSKDDDEVLQQLVAEASQSVGRDDDDDKIAPELLSENNDDDELTKQIAYSILNQNLSPTGSICDDINHDNLNALASSISASDLKQISQVLTPSVLNSELGAATELPTDHTNSGSISTSASAPISQQLEIPNGLNFVSQPVPQDSSIVASSQGLLATDLSTVIVDSAQQLQKQTVNLATPQMLLPGVLQLGTPVLPTDLTPKATYSAAEPAGAASDANLTLGSNLVAWPQTGPQPTPAMPNGFPNLTTAFQAPNLSLGGLKLAYPVQALLPGTAVVATRPDGNPLNFTGQQFPGQTLLTIATSLAQATTLQNCNSAGADSSSLENGT